MAISRFYPVYSGPGLHIQRSGPALLQRAIQTRVFTRSVTRETITHDGSLDHQRSHAGAMPKSGPSEYPLFEIVDGIPVQRIDLPRGWRREPVFYSRLAKYCRERSKETDVVHFLDMDKWSAPWLPRIRRLGIGTVYSCTMVGELSSNRWKQAWQRVDRRFPLNLVDQVTAMSGVMKRYLESLGVSTPIQVIPEGPDLERFRPIGSSEEKSHLRHKLGLEQGCQIILAIGQITPRKGTDVLIEAFARLCHDHPNARLILVGPRSDLDREELTSFRERLQKTVMDANAQDRVNFTGTVNNVEDYIRAADMLVIASRREGVPNVMSEAMACGLPVISTPFIGLPEEIGVPGTHYILSSWDTKVLAADIGKLLSDEGYRRTLGQQARHWVAENLDTNRSLDQIATLYRELASRARRKKLSVS